MPTSKEKYKTNIPWMPEIPSHWEVRRLKYIAKIKSSSIGKNDTGDIPTKIIHYNDVVKNSLIDSQHELQKTKCSATDINNFNLRCGDIILTKDSMDINNIADVCNIGNVKNTVCGYHLYIITIENANVKSAYMAYCLGSSIYKDYFLSVSLGVTIIGLSRYKLLNTLLPIPPKQEQIAIANYLDIQSKKIKHFIKKKQAFIELLKEQRQAVINKAVTKGINPNVTLKDSGIDWLGDIPSHWKVWRLRHVCKITTGGRNTEDRVDNGKYPFYVRSQTIERINSYSFDGIGILTAGDGVGVGKVFHLVDGKFDFHQRVYLFYDIIEKIAPEFLVDYLRFNLIKDLMRYNAKSTVDSVRLPILKDFKVIVPPKKEQAQIVSHIKTETAKIDQAIAKAQKEIALIKEYKEAMIAEAVLGKFNHKIVKS